MQVVRLEDVVVRSDQIHWTEQEAAWKPRRDDGGNIILDGEFPVGEGLVTRNLLTVRRPLCLLYASFWIGMFGGIPSRDQQPDPSSADELARQKGAGQIQEVTCTLYAQPGDGRRVRLWERDRHQLDPSDSWEGTGSTTFAVPILLPVGSKLFYVARTSQRDRGAHTRGTIRLARAFTVV